MLEIRKLAKSFSSKKVFENLDANFGESGISVIVGLNGSGKTTLLNIINSIIEEDAGTVELDGISKSSKYFKRKIFYIPSDFMLPEYLTANELAKFIFKQYRVDCFENFSIYLKLLELNKYSNDLVETYSFGMKKKLQIAISLALNVSIVIADEVFNGLDLETTLLVELFFNHYAKKNKIILVSHEINVSNHFNDDIRILKDGKLLGKSYSANDVIKEIRKDHNLNDKIGQFKKHFVVTDVFS